MIVFISISLAFSVVSGSEVSITPRCFGCICDAVSPGSCVSGIGCDQHGLCGPFRINWNYWNKAGRITLEDDKNPIGAWNRCVDDLQCASRVVKGYMEKYAEDCNRNGELDCIDFAEIHHLSECSQFTNKGYMKNVTDCFNRYRSYDVSIPYVDAKGGDLSYDIKLKIPKLIPIPDSCFACICQASSGKPCGVAESCKHGKCGFFNINRDYWSKAGNITFESENPNVFGAFERCTTNTKCASQVVQSYMDRFAWDCDGNGAIDCNDYARIHHLGSCDGDPNKAYQREFNRCASDTEKGLVTYMYSSSGYIFT